MASPKVTRGYQKCVMVRTGIGKLTESKGKPQVEYSVVEIALKLLAMLGWIAEKNDTGDSLAL
jgi:hypothetical protein